MAGTAGDEVREVGIIITTWFKISERGCEAPGLIRKSTGWCTEYVCVLHIRSAVYRLLLNQAIGECKIGDIRRLETLILPFYPIKYPKLDELLYS